ncbi:hypothetical protein MRB53_007666 [Persea americana]|uniref:Uncharacterized protein n=1 Tax=Persea americana TaxID=3435 RepID=A0ACC2MK75_PERAE|nr:hypothetical protein MRB53_007666 [Persea americana]
MALISKVWHIGETLFPRKIQMLCTPDDKKVMQQIQAVHSPDANLNVDENALLAMAEDILHHATPTTHLSMEPENKPIDQSMVFVSQKQGGNNGGRGKRGYNGGRGKGGYNCQYSSRGRGFSTVGQNQGFRPVQPNGNGSQQQYTAPFALIQQTVQHQTESRNAGSKPSAVGTTWSHPTELSLEVQPSWDGLTGINVQNSKRPLVATVSAPPAPNTLVHNMNESHDVDHNDQQGTSSDEDIKMDSQILADKPHQHGISEALAFTIHKIGCELSCNCSGEGYLKSITQAVFNTVKKYSWEDKVVIALSAFAVNYGEFCLLLQVHASNSLAKNVVQLKPLPDISEREPLISALLKVVMDVAKCIIYLMDLPSQYISPDKHPLSEALTYIPYAVYWAIKGIVACSSQSIGLMNMSHEYVTSNAEARKKLTDLAQILKSIHAHLANHLALCHEHIEDQTNNRIYYNLTHLMESGHIDNMEILMELIRTKDTLPLFNGVSKNRPGVIRDIKEMRHFEKKPLMVVLNGHGKVVCSNAYHKIMVWGNAAYPFDNHRVETLWKVARWSLEFLVDGIASEKEQWGWEIIGHGSKDLIAVNGKMIMDGLLVAT